MKTNIVLLMATAHFLPSCQSNEEAIASQFNMNAAEYRIHIDSNAKTIAPRFTTPLGFERIPSPPNSFQSYLSNFPLHDIHAKVYYYNGIQKPSTKTYASVLYIDIGNKDLQQCADAVIRLRVEYLYGHKRYDEILFRFTNGFAATYKKWAEGYRIRIKGEHTSWYRATESDYTYKTFRQYLEMVFSYAGTRSLAQELKPVSINNIQPGDVFIQGGSPGHAVIVMDVARNRTTGKQIFMIAQSYMPAQSIHVLVNQHDREISPWYGVNEGDKLYTPEWVFNWGDLKRFN